MKSHKRVKYLMINFSKIVIFILTILVVKGEFAYFQHSILASNNHALFNIA